MIRTSGLTREVIHIWSIIGIINFSNHSMTWSRVAETSCSGAGDPIHRGVNQVVDSE